MGMMEPRMIENYIHYLFAIREIMGGFIFLNFYS